MPADTDDVVQQMGLLLTQVRVARMSLEHIERSTARFAGLALAATAGAPPDRPAFGAPPLFEGALKVYVVNIDDLVEAASGDTVFETMLGGIGRLVGGLFGGFVGGALGGVTVPYVVDRLAAAVESLERISNRLLDTLGLSKADWRVLLGLKPDASERAVTKPAEPPSPMSLAIGDVIGRFTPPQVIALVDALTRTVDALIMLIPFAVGAIATLLSTLGDLRLEIVGWIGFALRNLLLLRAVAVAVLADTASLVAPVAATVLGAVARMADVVLSGLGTLLGRTITAAFTSARILASGLTASVNAAVMFLTGTVLPLLNYVQQTPMFRLFAWFVTAVPTMLVALAAAAGHPVAPAEEMALRSMSASGTALLAAPVPAAPTTTTLSAGEILQALGPTATADVEAEMKRLTATARSTTGAALTATSSVLTESATALRDAAKKSTTSLGGVLDEQLDVAHRHIGALDTVMQEAEGVAARRPESTIDRIAASYRQWLTAGGMQMLLGQITLHFAGANEAARKVLAAAVDAEPRRDVVVDVSEVVIELGAPAPGAATQPGAMRLPDAAGAYPARLAAVKARGGDEEDLIPVGGEEVVLT